jgi:hypothetical protein
MAADAGLPAWTPERFSEEVNLIVVDMLGVPPDQKLGYLKGRIAALPEPYRTAAETLLLQRETLMANAGQQPSGPPGPWEFLREAIQAVPAVKYALGVGGVVAVIAIIGGFGINYKVAVIGFPIVLIMMFLLLIFAKLAGAKPQYFLAPFVILTWFSIITMIATILFVFTGVFFGVPLDLRHWLAKG